ncbi:MAG: 2-oxoacid:acceptor oxidoreductase subunit alpha [Acidobacteriia bacterium]|jgi:2-oxoglutarate ferredoxin oxidoreductase subunit alpha|nr:2-oxoacid:acceptor oxidoreductase subunit alpha [Terriglobia bacterium]
MAYFSWMVGGPQGSGINVSAEILAKALMRAGYYVFGQIEYHSNIKGKHSSYRLRISDEPVHSHVEEVHLLSALDEETLVGDMYHEFPAHRGHAHEIAPGGAILYDAENKKFISWIERDDIFFWEMPYAELLDRALTAAGKPGQARAYRIMTNTLALGASVGALGFDFEPVAEAIRDSFGSKAGKVAQLNVDAARLAYEYAAEHFQKQMKYKLPPNPGREGQIMVKGTQAVGLAKLKAGCGLQTYYPISPATDESVYLESYQGQYNLVVLQTEDEVSAIDAAVMGAHGGVRSATSTSGPGFALMPEGLGFSAITEAPGPVVVIYQRGGPSTGLPTRHEQGDLLFALHAGQGDIPRIVLASGDIEECFYDTFDAFNYADRYQVPVIVLVDKHLASSYQTLPPFATEGLQIDRGKLFDPRTMNGNGDYLRYAFTEDGISPRSVPGQEGGIFWTTTDEHDPRGHITEGIGNRLAMMEKRMGKLAVAAREIPAEKKFRLFGPSGGDAGRIPVLIVGWGSTKGAIVDALRQLDPQQETYRFLQVRMLRPFPTEIASYLRGAGKVICFDCNYTGQLAYLVRAETGFACQHSVVKYDGRPFSENEIIAAIEHAVANGGERIVISEGRVIQPGDGRKQFDELVALRERREKMLPPMVPLPPGYNK